MPKQTKKKQSKTVAWGFCANLYGSWVDKPVKFTIDDAYDKFWVSGRASDMWADSLGLVEKDSYFSFLSTDKKEAETFFNGYMAGRKILKSMFPKEK